MFISIIVPVYNVAPYVEQCLRSVVNQTMTNGVECIVVDDCGQDDSMEIVEKTIAGYEGNIEFRILHHEYNRGLSAARNTGIDAARGVYIYFLDSDDMIVPECIELMVNCAQKYPDTQMIFSGSKATAGGYRWLDYTIKNLPEYSNNRDWLQLSMLKRYDFGMTAWNKLVRRDFVMDNKLYFVEDLVHEDEVWNFEVAKHIQSASFVKVNTYVYNVRSNSIVTEVTNDVRWERLFALWNVMLSKIGKGEKEIRMRAISNYILKLTRWKFPKKHRWTLCKLFWKLCIKKICLLSFWLFLQGLLALCNPSKYPNRFTCSRIEL